MRKILSVLFILLLCFTTFSWAAQPQKKTVTIQVFTSPKTVYVDGVLLKGLKDFEYDIKKGTQVVSGSDDELMMMYDGNIIEGKISLSGLSMLLDKHLKEGSTFKIEYFEAEKEGSKVKEREFSGCRIIKSYFSYDIPDKVQAIYIFKATGASNVK